MKKIFLMLFMFLFIGNVSAITLAPNAKSAILIEASSGEIIYKNNENEKRAPASMTKMMSLILIMEEIESGNLKWDEKIKISETAASMGGSQIYLEAGESMTVKDLVKGISMASANDAVVALAERIDGTEEEFVKSMNKRGKKLGLTNTNFKNSTGLDEEGHYSSAKDMAKIARELVRHKKILEFSSTYEDYLRQNTNKKFWLVNTNKLIKTYEGMDGLKTGFTQNALYCLTATATKNDMRLIGVVMGEKDSKTRNSEMTSMLDYGFNTYTVKNYLTKDTKVGVIKNDKSNVGKANVIPIDNIKVLNKKGSKKRKLSYELNITENKLPIYEGDIVGNIDVYENGKKIYSINATIDKDLEKANILELLIRNIGEIFTGENIF